MNKRNVSVHTENNTEDSITESSLSSITDEEWKFIFQQIPLHNTNEQAILKKKGKLKSYAPVDQCPAWNDDEIGDDVLKSHSKIRLIHLQPVHYDSEYNSFNMDDWKNHTKSFHFTLKDLKQLKPGDTIQFLSLNRNCFDTPCSRHKTETCFTARTFFNSEMCTYTHKEGCRGRLVFHFEKGNHILEDFEFHIEYRPDCYYPLTNGKLIASGDDDNEYLVQHNDQAWDTFPDECRVGYRGPIIPDIFIDSLPKIYHLGHRYVCVEFPDPFLKEFKQRIREKRKKDIEDMRNKGILRSSERIRCKKVKDKQVSLA